MALSNVDAAGLEWCLDVLKESESSPFTDELDAIIRREQDRRRRNVMPPVFNDELRVYDFTPAQLTAALQQCQIMTTSSDHFGVRQLLLTFSISLLLQLEHELGIDRDTSLET